MTARTCATCDHWTRDSGSHMGDCSCAKFAPVKSTRDIMEQPPDAAAYFKSDAWRGLFVTGEAFGCVHHHTAKP